MRHPNVYLCLLEQTNASPCACINFCRFALLLSCICGCKFRKHYKKLRLFASLLIAGESGIFLVSQIILIESERCETWCEF